MLYDIREYELLGQWAFINLAANNRLNVPSLCTEHKTNKKRIMQERADKTAEKLFFLCVCVLPARNQMQNNERVKNAIIIPTIDVDEREMAKWRGISGTARRRENSEE